MCNCQIFNFIVFFSYNPIYKKIVLRGSQQTTGVKESSFLSNEEPRKFAHEKLVEQSKSQCSNVAPLQSENEKSQLLIFAQLKLQYLQFASKKLQSVMSASSKWQSGQQASEKLQSYRFAPLNWQHCINALEKLAAAKSIFLKSAPYKSMPEKSNPLKSSKSGRSINTSPL